jgi:hypothetical protein
VDPFISAERKVSKIKGTGIQYLPGHVEPLTDLIIKEYLPSDEGLILDLGGGGLRFAIPVASQNRKITVVDSDKTGTDIDLIYSKLKKNKKVHLPDINLLRQNIKIENEDIFSFLENSIAKYSLIAAFRLIHFFNEKETDRFFRLVSFRIKKTGTLVLSGFSIFEEDDSTYNEIYCNSEPVSGNEYYRKFFNNISALKIQQEQNLSQYFQMFSEDYINGITRKYNFKMIVGGLPSTRVVRGYIFTI